MGADCGGVKVPATTSTREECNAAASTQEEAADSNSNAVAFGVAAGVVLLAILLVTKSYCLAREAIQKNLAYEAFKQGKAIPADEWEIDRDLLVLGKEIGSGNF